MNKIQLIEHVSAEAGMSLDSARKALNAVLGGIETGLKQDGEVVLASFGGFRLADQPARQATNPNTGAKIDVAACKRVRFKPSTVLHSSMNE